MSGRRPVYPRLLRLRHVHPNGWQRGALGEGALAVAGVLVLADLATAWTLLVLPLTVAVVVKSHDLLAGLLAEPRDVSTAGQPEVRADVQQGDAGSGPGAASDRDTSPHADNDRDTSSHPDGDRVGAAPPAGVGTPGRTRTATPTATRTRRSRPGRPAPAADPADSPGAVRSPTRG